jgi:methionyl-tRNA formyltransferase
LPKYRGAAPIQHAILSGDAETGITIMQMDVGLDTGDIWSLYPCKIQDTDTSETLHTKLQDLGAKALVETLQNIRQHTIHRIAQDSNQSTYAHKIHKDDGKMLWQDSASDLERRIRAFNPWPIAFSHTANQTIRIWSATVINRESEATNDPKNVGRIIAASKAGIDVITGKGILRLVELQLAGGKRLPVSQLLLSKADLFAVGNYFE